jgi:hypothetical protein
MIILGLAALDILVRRILILCGSLLSLWAARKNQRDEVEGYPGKLTTTGSFYLGNWKKSVIKWMEWSKGRGEVSMVLWNVRELLRSLYVDATLLHPERITSKTGMFAHTSRRSKYFRGGDRHCIGSPFRDQYIVVYDLEHRCWTYQYVNHAIVHWEAQNPKGLWM